MENFYPEMITNLPKADILFDGVKGWLLQGNDNQVVFFDIAPIGEVAEHAHGAQYGFVIDGEMDLTIGGVTKTYGKGDSYFIPEGVLHSAVFKSHTFVMDVFADVDRYSTKD